MTIAAGGHWRPAVIRLVTGTREASGACASWLRASYAADNDRLFLWIPVFMGAGIALYFGLDFEPSLWVAILPPPFAAVLAWRTRHRPFAGPMSMALLCVSIGLVAAVLRFHAVAAPVLERPMSGELVGLVLSAERTETGALSAVLAPVSFAGLPSERLPAKVRLNVRLRDAALRPGAEVRLRARLMPPPEPVLPNGFDFARQAWFSSIGAV